MVGDIVEYSGDGKDDSSARCIAGLSWVFWCYSIV